MVWSDPQVQELAGNYVAVADELHNLRTGATAEAKFFQRVFEQKQKHPGHQGVFLATPSGRLLASSTCYEAEKVIALLKNGLSAWEEMSVEERFDSTLELIQADQGDRPEDLYPVNGLVLRVTARDLPESGLGADRNERWHRYYLWFNEEEVRSFVPDQFETGQSCELPDLLAKRIACLALLDKGNVDGFTKPFRDRDVTDAQIAFIVDEISDTTIRFRVSGSTATRTADGQAFVRNMPQHERIPEYRGVTTQILGWATWNSESAAFVDFKMVAVGTRFGGAYVGRQPDDWGEHPIGFSFVLGGSEPSERIAPEFEYRYPWLEQQ